MVHCDDFTALGTDDGLNSYEAQIQAAAAHKLGHEQHRLRRRVVEADAKKANYIRVAE